jgi:hypothetical protein
LHNGESTKKNRKKREGVWRIVIPMPEAINFVDGRWKKHT